MATTLVIKNANFSVNKIETVSFAEKACTDIEINDASYALTSIGGTQNVDYTVTPSDTTDSITWSSSDTDVVTVENGVITAVGIGEAVVTVTCGSHSDTVNVGVTAAFNPTWKVGYQIYDDLSSGNLSYMNCASQSASAGAAQTTGTYPIRNSDGLYPYMIPKGAKKIHIVAANCYIGCIFSKSDESEYAEYAIVKPGGNRASSTVGIADEYTYTIPDGVDCFGLTIRKKSGTMAQEDLANYTVTFIAE